MNRVIVQHRMPQSGQWQDHPVAGDGGDGLAIASDDDFFRWVRQAGADGFQKCFLGGPEFQQGGRPFILSDGKQGDFCRMTDGRLALVEVLSTMLALDVDADWTVSGSCDDGEIIAVREIEME
jgi:hypothetical protein